MVPYLDYTDCSNKLNNDNKYTGNFLDIYVDLRYERQISNNYPHSFLRHYPNYLRYIVCLK